MTDQVTALMDAARSKMTGNDFLWVVMDDFESEADVVYATTEDNLLDIMEGRAARVFRNETSVVPFIYQHIQELLDKSYTLPEATSISYL